MQPSRWYYRINEKLPKRINFTPQFDVVGRVTLPTNMQLKNIIYKRKHPDTMEEWFKTLPPQDFIIKLRNDINPDYWYIFPEELE